MFDRLIRVAVLLEEAPAHLSVALEAMKVMELQSLRRLTMLVLLVVLAAWALCTACRFLASRLTRSVVKELLEDDEITALASKRFVRMMVDTNHDKDFQSSMHYCTWSPASQTCARQVMASVFYDDQFVEGFASMMQELAANGHLKNAIKEQIRETLQDEHIHRAMIQGSLDALKPEWIKKLEGEQTTSLIGSSRGSKAENFENVNLRSQTRSCT